ncbi:MAG: hypothetical protein GY711_20085 [bacterium]|nr:hypothetical protein [bacterium]
MLGCRGIFRGSSLRFLPVDIVRPVFALALGRAGAPFPLRSWLVDRARRGSGVRR